MIKEVEKLYFKSGMKIADVTFGKGAFWKKINLEDYDFYPSDLVNGIDFRKLPYENNDFDIVVLDPPYVHNPGSLMVNKMYRNSETTKGFYHKDIINLYKEGMEEAFRVLKDKGYLLVKCQDEIEASKQKWSHIEIFDIAAEIGYYAKDLFVLHQNKNPIIQHKKQQHARKNHSYLWIFQKNCKQIKKMI